MNLDMTFFCVLKRLSSVIGLKKLLLAFTVIFVMLSHSSIRIASAFRGTKAINLNARSLMRFSAVSMNSPEAISYSVGFMFPGQGAQAVGMAGALCNEVPAAKDLFDKASAILGYDLLAKCVNGPKEELDKTDVAQTASTSMI